MPRPHPPACRRQAIALAREHAEPIAQIAADIGISESCLRSWLTRADIAEGKREGLTTRRARPASSREPGAQDGKGDPGEGRGLLRQREHHRSR